MGSLAEPRQHQIRLVCWPYHNGLRNVSMGRGASTLANDEEFRAGIEQEGWTVTTAEIASVDESDREIVRVMELIRRLAAEVRQAVTEGAFPLVLDDPDENESGFFDVMGLKMLTGRGWRALRNTIPGHVPIPERNVILAAPRDREDYQRERLRRSDLITVPGEIDPRRFEEAVDSLGERTSRVYLHVDLDSVDAGEARANKYSAPGGPSLARLLDCIRLARQRFTIAGAAITAFDPDFDAADRTLQAARAVSREIVRGIWT